MNALRKIVNAKNHSIHIDLPDDFPENNLEVIVMPLQKDGHTLQKKISRKELFGKYKEMIEMSADFNEPLECMKEYME